MAANALVCFILVFTVNVYSHYIFHRHHILNTTLNDQMPDELESGGTKQNRRLLQKSKNRKYDIKHKRSGSLDIYNPVAHFVPDSYEDINPKNGSKFVWNIQESTDDINDGVTSKLHLSRKVIDTHNTDNIKRMNNSYVAEDMQINSDPKSPIENKDDKGNLNNKNDAKILLNENGTYPPLAILNPQNIVHDAGNPTVLGLPNANPEHIGNSGFYLLPNGYNHGITIPGNNVQGTPSVSAQGNIGNLLHVVQPSNINIGSASAIQSVVPTNPSINNSPNYALMNINGQPTLVQILNSPTIDMVNNIQTPISQGTTIQTQGNIGKYIFLQTSNLDPTNTENTLQSTGLVKKPNWEIQSDPGSSNTQNAGNNQYGIIIQPGFMIPTLKGETLNIDPR